ncbi:hypothetical protein WJX82_006731 [Trebouxia sp. C0006]
MQGMSPLPYSVDSLEEAKAPQRPARSVKARAPFPVLGAKCYDCQGFGQVTCPSCGGGEGLTPEQRRER